MLNFIQLTLRDFQNGLISILFLIFFFILFFFKSRDFTFYKAIANATNYKITNATNFDLHTLPTPVCKRCSRNRYYMQIILAGKTLTYSFTKEIEENGEIEFVVCVRGVTRKPLHLYTSPLQLQAWQIHRTKTQK